MKNFVIFFVMFVLSAPKVFAQIGSIAVSTPVPNPIGIGGTGTGTITLILDQPWPGGEVLNISAPTSPFSTYHITSITTLPEFEAWDFSDPTSPYTFSNSTGPLAAGTYVFTFVITPGGTEPDLNGTDITVAFGYLTNTAHTSLPVTLSSFTVAKEGQSAQLSWATTEESSSGYFDVEHSVNAKNWAKLGTRAAAGESKITEYYNYTHTSPANGTNYYRLKMVDKDGTFAYSSIRSLSFDGGEGISLYPNPVAEKLFVQNARDVKSVSVVNASGRTVLAREGYSAAQGIGVSGLAKGIYFVKVLQKDGAVSTHKVVVGGQ